MSSSASIVVAVREALSSFAAGLRCLTAPPPALEGKDVGALGAPDFRAGGRARRVASSVPVSQVRNVE